MNDISEDQPSGRRVEAERRREAERDRKLRPATTGDIERLISAVNTGWVGRGFAIGFGMVVLSFIAGIIVMTLWGNIFSGGY